MKYYLVLRGKSRKQSDEITFLFVLMLSLFYAMQIGLVAN